MNCPKGNVSVTEEVSHRAGFYKVGCTLISISLRWGPDPKQTPTTPLILNIIYFINPFKPARSILRIFALKLDSSLVSTSNFDQIKGPWYLKECLPYGIVLKRGILKRIFSS